MTDATNPTAEAEFEPAEVEEVETDQASGVDDQADEDDSEGSPSDNEEEEYEDVERNGKTYKVPKALKPELMMQADYQRKTQEAAEAQRRLDAERAAWKQLSDDVLEARSEAKAIESRLSDIRALTEADWAQLAAMDRQDGGSRYDKLMRELNILPQKLTAAEEKSRAKAAEATQKQSESQTKLIEQGQAILARDIPGWGPELGAKLVSFVKSEYGIDEQRHGEAFLDPALVKMAHAAFKAKEAERKTSAIKRVESTPKPVPASRGGAAPAAGLSDKLSTAEWMKREREARERKAAPAFRQR